jgi:hypothetical protein
MKDKNMKHLLSLSAFFASLIFIMASCGGPSPANNAGNANNANGNLANTGPSNNQQDAPTLNNAPTLGPVVQQYYQALEKKDDAAVRETLTKEFVARLEEDMKADKEKNLAAFMAKDEYRPGQSLEVRNEKIDGDKGQAEIRGGAYKNWTAFSFAKENGKWRFTGGSPVIDNMPKSNTNSPH